jgi:hypothetical protein
MKGASKLQVKLITMKEESRKEQQTMYAQQYKEIFKIQKFEETH